MTRETAATTLRLICALASVGLIFANIAIPQLVPNLASDDNLLWALLMLFAVGVLGGEMIEE